jgi:ApbE superfamily uncharacterized protein (UPF0280 family)
MSGPIAAMLPDGRRLHLQHGPIDLVIEARGAPDDVRAAYAQAVRGFADVLPTLVKELPVLRAPLSPSPPRSGGEGRGPSRSDGKGEVVPGTSTHLTRSLRSHPLPPLRGRRGLVGSGPKICSGPVAKRMVAACRPYNDVFITPMAAVAGAVADHVLARLCAGRRLQRAYVNDGGDIAFHLAAGQSLTCGLVSDLAAPGIDGRFELTADLPVRGLATSGRACKGSGGRSFSLGIADAVTVLARDAAAADAAATIIANAVDLPGHGSITRAPARSIDPDSDLGDIPVTVGLGILTDEEIDCALAEGARRAAALREAGHIHGAVLVLRRHFLTIGAGLPLLAAA